MTNADKGFLLVPEVFFGTHNQKLCFISDNLVDHCDMFSLPLEFAHSTNISLLRSEDNQ